MAISAAFEQSLHNSFVGARAKRHEFITVEHLLLCLLDDPDALPVLEACRADIVDLRRSLEEFIEKNTPTVDGTSEVDSQPTLGFQRVIQRAIMHVRSKDVEALVDGSNCLLALYGEKDSHAIYYLTQQGVTRVDVVKYLISGTTPTSFASAEPTEAKLVEVPVDSIQAAIDRTKASNVGSELRSTGLKVFISYSHTDSQCLERLLVHLRPLEKKKLIDSWSDKKLRAGDRWEREIEKRLRDSAVAVLLISADFLASDFIVNDELPPLLVKAESEGLRILPVILKPCGFLRDSVLRSFQSANDPALPLLGMTEIEQEKLYDSIASEIHSEILLRSRVTS